MREKPRDFTRLTQEDGGLSREDRGNLVVSNDSAPMNLDMHHPGDPEHVNISR